MSEYTSKEIGNYIKKLRKDKKISAKDLGAFVGYSQSYISALENGINKNVPSKEVLNKIAKALSSIGYEYNQVQENLFDMAGFVSPFAKHDEKFISDFSRYRGFYDNLTDKNLEKPYLLLNYLLSENGLDVRYSFDDGELSENVILSDKQKQFINNVIHHMLIKDGIQEKIQQAHDEAQKENSELSRLAGINHHISNQLKVARNHLKAVMDLEDDYSDDHFKRIYNENNLQNYFKDEDISFNRSALHEVKNKIADYIEKKEKEQDDLGY